MLVTSTVRATDLKDAGETISVIELSTGKALGSYKVGTKPSPSGEAPVEILFVPGASPPVAYVTNMYGGTLWVAVWNPARRDLDLVQAFDFATTKAGVTVVDLGEEKVVGTVDTLPKAGLNPNSIVLLPEWNHPAGH